MDRVQSSYQLLVSEPAETGLKRRPSTPSRGNPASAEECWALLCGHWQVIPSS